MEILVKYANRIKRTAFAAGAGICAWCFAGCGPLQSLAGFNVNTALPKTSTSTLSSPTLIDAGAYETNNDTGDGCLYTAGSGVGFLDGGNHNGDGSLTRGCMDQSPIAQTDNNAWFVGFFQNYLFSGLPIVTGNNKFSAFVNTSYFSGGLGIFGTLGAGLNIIDSGMGLEPTGTVPESAARRMRFAKMSNGNIVAVFLVHDPSAGVANATDRVVFANVYDVKTHTWGTATQLGTSAKSTDVAEDSTALVWNTPFCAPAVAAGPDDSAMATWCETGTGGEADVMYAQYISGAWTSEQPLIPDASDVAFPGFSGQVQSFTINTVSSTSIQAGDTFTFAFDGTSGGNIDCSTDCTASVTMKAVAATPSSANEFEIFTKADGTVLICETMQQMLASVLGATPSVGTATLGQRGLSTWIDPTCTDTASSTWNFAVIFNKAQNSLYRTIGTATDNSVTAVVASLNGTDGIQLNAGTVITNPVPYSRSALVDLAADGLGNYVLVRSVVAPVFDDNNPTTVGTSASTDGRQLIGHVFQAGTGWVPRSIDFGLSCSDTDLLTTNSCAVPKAFLISRNPSCYSGNTSDAGTTYFPCSVRHPKMLMSSSGLGLVLYYQNQLNTESSTVATSSLSFPNRLWYSTYSSGSGFASTSAATVDSDVICSSSDLRNDESVCEGGSSGLPCQVEGEPRTLPLDPFFVDTDIPPIAAAMNNSGRAVIVYHKETYNASGVCNGTVGVNVVFYDPVSGAGMGEPAQLDDGLGNTMHAAAAINSSGNAAVVWEEIVSGLRYVYVRAYNASTETWSTQQQANTGYTASSDAAMPSVAYSDAGQVLITFTADTGSGTTRRQYETEFTP